MRALWLAAMLFATTTDAWAECRPRWRLASAGVTSHARWRALELGDGLFVNPRFELGLCGRPITTIGAHGLDLSAEAWIPLDGDDADLVSAQLRYRRHFGDDRESWVGAGFSQYYWGAGEEWSGEVAVEMFRKVNLGSFTFWPYAQAAHDFKQLEATYARGGVFHRVGIQRARGDEIFLDLDVSVSASDYTNDFGYHATETSGWVHWPLPKFRERDFGVEVGGGYTWAANEIARDGGWVGVRVKVTQ